MASDVLTVRTTRGGVTELESRVIATIVGADGNLVDSFGDIGHRVPLRSTAKPLQAIALVESGAADALAVTSGELALACASHNGEDGHVEVLRAWLERIGLSESSLQCGAALPYSRPVADQYVAHGGHPARLRHNCSGKHTGFLTLGVHLGADPADYLNRRGAVQTAALSILEERCATTVGDDDIVQDGCGAPCPCVTLDALARGWSSLLADPSGAAGSRIREAITANPWNLAGTGRFDTAMVETTNGTVISKVGADGLHIAMAANGGVVVATKAIDGSRVAAEEALVYLLRTSGALTDAQAEALPRASVRDDAGREVGRISVHA